MGYDSLTGELWFGLAINALHYVTSQAKIYFPYKQFTVGPASKQYTLGFLLDIATTDPFCLHLTPTSHGAALNTMKFKRLR